MEILLICSGLIIGAILSWIWRGTRIKILVGNVAEGKTEIVRLNERLLLQNQQLEEARDNLEDARSENSVLQIRNAEIEATSKQERLALDEKLSLLQEAKDKLSDAFKALSAEALKANNDSFLTLAESHLGKFQTGARSDLESRQAAIQQLVGPLKESLDKVDVTVKEIEKARLSAYSSISAQIEALASTGTQLRTETTNLVRALRTPQGRGRWGELQLRRLVEAAGMLKYCDFIEQAQVDTDGGRLRPDMIIKLPGGRQIVVDAKTPLLAYLESIETTDDDARSAALRRHAEQVKDHLNQLSGKAYWEQFAPTPEIVVMFLEAESIFSAALQGDPTLIEYGAQKQVTPATPTTLLSLLRAVHYGWRQEQIAENAHAISELGTKLYKRILTLGTHFAKVGHNLRSAVGAYNDAVGSLESSVLPGARKFKELGVSTKEDIKEATTIEISVREISASELILPPADLENEIPDSLE